MRERGQEMWNNNIRASNCEIKLTWKNFFKLFYVFYGSNAHFAFKSWISSSIKSSSHHSSREIYEIDIIRRWNRYKLKRDQAGGKLLCRMVRNNKRCEVNGEGSEWMWVIRG